VLAVLVNEQDADTLYVWLKGMPFVRDEGGKYHPVVRTQMLRHKRRESPQGWAEVHDRLANFYIKLRDELILGEEKKYLNQTWQKYSLEALYHQLCHSPLKGMIRALNEFLPGSFVG
jgi:hypothetical protein